MEPDAITKARIKAESHPNYRIYLVDALSRYDGYKKEAFELCTKLAEQKVPGAYYRLYTM